MRPALVISDLTKPCCHSCSFTHFLPLWADLPTLYTQKTSLSVSDVSVTSHRNTRGRVWWQSWHRVSEWGRWTLPLTRGRRRGTFSGVFMQNSDQDDWMDNIKASGHSNLHCKLFGACIFRHFRVRREIITGRLFICFRHNCPHRDFRVTMRDCPACVHYHRGV